MINANKILLVLISVFFFYSVMYSQTDSTSIYNDTTKILKINDKQGLSYVSDKAIDYTFTKHDIGKYNYTSMGDLLHSSMNIRMLRQSGFNHFEVPQIYASKPEHFKVVVNNIEFRDNLFGNYNINQVNVEYFNYLAMSIGSNALQYASNNGSLILQERIYNAKTPVTRFWYSDAGRDFIGVEGIYTHNLTNNSNLTLNLRQQRNNGEYENNNSENWNLNSTYRIQLDSVRFLKVAHLFSNSAQGQHGGLNRVLSDNVFDRNASVSNISNMNERNIRNTILINGNEELLGSMVDYNLYYSNVEWTRDRPNSFALDTSFKSRQKFIENSIGASVNFSTVISNFRNNINSAINYVYIGDNEFTGEASYTNFMVSDRVSLYNFNLVGNVRFNYNKLLLNLGTNYKLSIDSNQLVFDLSYSEDNTLIFKEYIDKSLLFLTKFRTNWYQLELYYRNYINYVNYSLIGNTNNPLLNLEANSISNQSFLGVNFTFEQPLLTSIFREDDSFNGRINLLTNYSLNEIVNLPLFETDLSIRYKIKVNASILNLELQTKLWYQEKGLAYFPQFHLFYTTDFTRKFHFDGLNFHLNAKLGNANAKLSYMNILNSGFYNVELNPLLTRYFRFSVAWSFFD